MLGLLPSRRTARSTSQTWPWRGIGQSFNAIILQDERQGWSMDWLRGRLHSGLRCHRRVHEHLSKRPQEPEYVLTYMNTRILYLTGDPGRAIEAPAVRRLFSTSPKDPRYHMLSHLSTKFHHEVPRADHHERRAALFLNRYTRTLTIMYATEGLSELLGISGQEMRGKSFYYCIQENCLKDAVRCLENAKANDSIAYLRFWYRDPRQDEDDQVNAAQSETQDEDSTMEDPSTSEEEMDLDEQRADDRQVNDINHHEANGGSGDSQALSSSDSVSPVTHIGDSAHLGIPHLDSRTSSDESNNQFNHENVFGDPQHRHSSASSVSNSVLSPNGQARLRTAIEVEAVVSCTSDGLVVCLRRAAPFLPQAHLQQPGKMPMQQGYANGLFAVPWATDPMLPAPQQRSQQPQRTGFAPSLTPAQAYHRPLAQSSRAPQSDFMSSIRECAVFAWALTGINGCLAEYSRGVPRGESQPVSGLPIWEPDRTSGRSSNQSTSEVSRLPQSRPSAIPSPSSIATGSYFAGASSHDHFHAPSNGRFNPSSTQQRLRTNREELSDDKSAQTVGVNGHSSAGIGDCAQSIDRQRDSPSAPTHMVDGVAGAFDNQRDPFSPERSTSSQTPRSSSGFGFGDPGLNNGVHPAKLLNSSRAPDVSAEHNSHKRPRNYYDPVRTDS